MPLPPRMRRCLVPAEMCPQRSCRDVRAGGSWRAGRNLALPDADQAARIVAEFPLAAAGLITAGVIAPLPVGL
jgi:hypothetical protein